MINWKLRYEVVVGGPRGHMALLVQRRLLKKVEAHGEIECHTNVSILDGLCAYTF